MPRITENFTTNEMKCPCCGECNMDSSYMADLQEMRTICGFGFRVNSGYRCKSHNAKVSKNSKNDHTRGRAADIHMTDRYKRFILLQHLLSSSHFCDIAIAKTFIHIGKGKSKSGIGVY